MKVLIAGDYCPSCRVADTFARKEYDSVLSEVRALTTEADYSIVNLECPVVLGDAKPIDKLGPHLRCTPNGIEALRWAGFDCVTLANNHFLDYGEKGVRDTLETLGNYSIDYVGGGMCLEAASRIIYKDFLDKKLAVINCCEHEFSIATDTTPGSNPLDPIRQYYAIKDAKNNADYVLVIVHGGHEHFQLPSPRMVETYRFFIDAGADAVVNHHQHCYSGFEVYKGKLISYGLGNFCFDDNDNHDGMWTEGYAVLISFSQDTQSYSFYPYRQCAAKPHIEILHPNAFKDHIDTLNSTILDSVLLRKRVDEYYDLNANHICNIFEPLFNRYYLGAKRRGWLPSLVTKARKLNAYDFVLCEAHREKLYHWFMK